MLLKHIIFTISLIFISVLSFSQSISLNKPVDEVWQQTVEIMANRGIAIQAIDRKTGLLVSTKQSFLNSYSKGKNIDKKSMVILDGGVKEAPSVVSGYYNIIIKPDGNRTLILISIVNLEAYYEKEMRGYKKQYHFEARSSGLFEKEMTSELSK